MKRYIRVFLLLLLTVAVLTVFCGCDAIDQMRESQAFLQSDDTIIWKGTTYKLLPESEYLSPELDYEQGIWVTEPDVPVLLMMTESKMMGQPSTDGMFLEMIDDYSFSNYYCRAEDYDAVCKRLQEDFEAEVVCYHYYVYDEEIWEYTEKQYILTQDQVDALTLVVTTVEPYSGAEKGLPAYQEALALYDCSEDMLLQRYTGDILIAGAQYYLVVETEADSLIFAVPEGCNAVFDQIVSTYFDAMQAEEELEELI